MMAFEWLKTVEACGSTQPTQREDEIFQPCVYLGHIFADQLSSCAAAAAAAL